MRPSDISPPTPLSLAIDVGGHASRAIVFDFRGEIVAEAFADIARLHPAPDRVEHSPQELVDAITSCHNSKTGNKC